MVIRIDAPVELRARPNVVVKTEGLKKSYKRGKLGVEALTGVDLEIYAGEHVAILGPSGCGKSTLLSMLGALDRPTSGTVAIGGIDLSTMNENQLAETRRRIGFVFQFFNLIQSLDARENVELSMSIAGVPRSERRKRAEALLALVGLEGRMYHKPHELSGGQQQRVAIARALANDPRFLLMDEPTGNLDSKTTMDILKLIRELNREKGITVIMITHDRSISQHANRVIFMMDGRIEDQLQAFKGYR
jgi:putative ABC transport system ATP-binding protein